MCYPECEVKGRPVELGVIESVCGHVAGEPLRPRPCARRPRRGVVGVQVDLGGCHAFMTEPKGDDRSVHARVEPDPPHRGRSGLALCPLPAGCVSEGTREKAFARSRRSGDQDRCVLLDPAVLVEGEEEPVRRCWRSSRCSPHGSTAAAATRIRGWSRLSRQRRKRQLDHDPDGEMAQRRPSTWVSGWPSWRSCSLTAVRRTPSCAS